MNQKSLHVFAVMLQDDTLTDPEVKRLSYIFTFLFREIKKGLFSNHTVLVF